jgi:S-formylglutathione hydrolase FrmB
MYFKTTRYHNFLQITAILVICLFAGTAFGQAPAKENPRDQTQKLSSKMMKRDMYYRVILPVGYDQNKEIRYPVVYLLHGMGGNYRAFSDITDEYFGRHDFIIVIPDGARGFWVDSATVPNDKYESHLMQELIPEVEKNFRVIADRQNRIISGTSMGGYGAIVLGLRHPDKFSLIGSIAGAVGVSQVTGKTPGLAQIGKLFDSIFGPLGGEHRNAHDIQQILNKKTPGQLKALPMIFQSHGTEDKLVELGNTLFLSMLQKKKIRHEYRELPGAHDPEYFADQIREFLDVADEHLIVPVVEVVSKIAKEKDGTAAVAEYRKLRSKFAGKYLFSQNQLNRLGYELLGMDKIEDAIEIFKLNVEMFPESSNPYDSLGEAYLKAGNKELALKNYKKSVELDPQNTSGIEAIEKLEGKEKN